MCIRDSAIDAAQVCLDGVDRHIEVGGDLVVHHPPRQVGEDIELARGERFDQALLLTGARLQAGDDLPERSVAEP